MNDTAYKSYRLDELEFQYNPRVSVPEYPELAKARAAQSLKVRESAERWSDVAYGKSRRETLDIYAAEKAGGPVLVYIHGGYWRSGSKEDNANFVPPYTERGTTVALVEYDLCPTVSVSDIVRQTRAAIGWVYRHIESYGGDPARLYVSGHSAGGHLTAMALAHDWEKEELPPNFIKGAITMSGVYDLEMVMRISANEQIRMTPQTAEENNPLLHAPRVQCPLLVAVGAAEPAGWKQMSRDYFEFCKRHLPDVDYLEVPGANHYTMSNELGDPESPLARAIFKLIGV